MVAEPTVVSNAANLLLAVMLGAPDIITIGDIMVNPSTPAATGLPTFFQLTRNITMIVVIDSELSRYSQFGPVLSESW